MNQSLRTWDKSKVPSTDGRSADARLMRRTRDAMLAHIGGKPTATQKATIDRVVWLTLHLARMDARALEAGEFSEHASRQYLAWSNSLTRTLRTLGIEAEATPKQAAEPPPEAADAAENIPPSDVPPGTVEPPTQATGHTEGRPSSFGRTRAGRRLRDTIADLVQHIGTPDAVQARLIDTAAQLELRIAEMDLQFQKTGKTDESYLTLTAQYARALRELGVTRKPR